MPRLSTFAKPAAWVPPWRSPANSCRWRVGWTTTWCWMAICGTKRGRGGRHRGRGAEQGVWLWQPGDGICLEPMEYPDAPNQPGFPVRWLAPGDVVQGAIVYRFTG